jgi:quercetin dioxygenase-like cupin family protein
MSTLTTLPYKVLAPGDGLRVGSGPGRDLIFKITGEETGGALDYVIIEVAPHGGPPLHVHHTKDELLHAAKGRFKVQIGEETFVVEEGGFAYLPRGIQHAFLNLTDETAELNVVFTPGGAHPFFEELTPAARAANPDRAAIAAVFEKHDLTLLGPPLTAD